MMCMTRVRCPNRYLESTPRPQWQFWAWADEASCSTGTLYGKRVLISRHNSIKVRLDHRKLSAPLPSSSAITTDQVFRRAVDCTQQVLAVLAWMISLLLKVVVWQEIMSGPENQGRGTSLPYL